MAKIALHERWVEHERETETVLYLRAHTRAHTHTQTPEKLLSVGAIQTFTPTEVERSGMDSRLR